MGSQATALSKLGEVLAARAIEVLAKQVKPTPLPQPHRLVAELQEDDDELFLVISKRDLLAALGRGTRHKTQEGADITVEGEFYFVEGGARYQFRLKLPPAWMRIDMLHASIAEPKPRITQEERKRCTHPSFT